MCMMGFWLFVPSARLKSRQVRRFNPPAWSRSRDRTTSHVSNAASASAPSPSTRAACDRPNNANACP